MAAILTTQQMTKRFGGLVAVDALELSVEEKSIHSIIGPNGAGKTTVFNCITGFYRPEQGSVVFGKHSLVGRTPDRIVKLGISRTYQNIRLFPNLTARENIMVGIHCHLKAGLFGIVLGLPSTQQEEKETTAEAERLLNFIQLNGKGEFLAKNFPYGEQRRLVQGIGRVEDLLQGIGRSGENRMFAEDQNTVLATFDDQGFGSHGQYVS